MEKESSILINIIGTGYDVSVGEVPPDLFEFFRKAVNVEKQSLHDLLFDEDFYKKYEISKANNSVKYASWKDFNDNAVYRGANLMENGQLEIWINRRRVKTYRFGELIGDATLFPLFGSEEAFINEASEANINKQIVIGFQEKGQLAKYKIKSGKFLYEELKLHIIQFLYFKSTIKLLYKITYSDLVLNSLKHDTVVTGTVFTMI